MPYAIAGTVRIYYEVTGHGPPLVLIPGLGADTRMFRSVVPALCDRFLVTVVDPRGGGRSDKPDEPYTIDLMADYTAAVLATVGAGPAHVAGLSMGGRIAMSLVMRHPEAVRSLVLVSTSAWTPPPRRFSWRGLVMDVLPRIPLPAKVDPQPHYAHLRQREASRSFDCRASLDLIRVPTAILHGRADRIVSLTGAEELYQAIRGASLITVPGGHLTFLARYRPVLVDVLTSRLGDRG